MASKPPTPAQDHSVRNKRLELGFGIIFGILVTLLTAIMADTHGKVDDLTRKEGADIAGLIDKLNDSNTKIAAAISKIEIEQAGFKVKVEDKLDAISAQKQRR